MSSASRLGYLTLAYLSKPKAERAIYRRIRKHKIRRIVELGVGDAVRAGRMIRVAQRYTPDDSVQYAGIDLFEASSQPGALRLIEAHRKLVSSGAKVRLLPGEAGPALSNMANSLPNTDLVILSESVSDEALESVWFYLPRMLHAGSTVLREQKIDEHTSDFKNLTLEHIQARAENQKQQLRRAA